jgi:hypothetical protein
LLSKIADATNAEAVLVGDIAHAEDDHPEWISDEVLRRVALLG